MSNRENDEKLKVRQEIDKIVKAVVEKGVEVDYNHFVLELLKRYSVPDTYPEKYLTKWYLVPGVIAKFDGVLKKNVPE